MSFLALDNTLELIRLLAPLCRTLTRHDPKLVDQIRRAATSVANNLAEGQARVGRDRRHLARIAYASAAEVATSLRVAVAWGFVTDVDIGAALTKLDRVRALTWGLAA